MNIRELRGSLICSPEQKAVFTREVRIRNVAINLGRP
jgi:hypothetical protein